MFTSFGMVLSLFHSPNWWWQTIAFVKELRVHNARIIWGNGMDAACLTEKFRKIFQFDDARITTGQVSTNLTRTQIIGMLVHYCIRSFFSNVWMVDFEWKLYLNFFVQYTFQSSTRRIEMHFTIKFDENEVFFYSLIIIIADHCLFKSSRKNHK